MENKNLAKFENATADLLKLLDEMIDIQDIIIPVNVSDGNLPMEMYARGKRFAYEHVRMILRAWEEGE